MKIKVQNTVSGLVPLTDNDYDNKKKLKLGEVYEVSIKQVRNYRFHRKYFALINLSWEYMNEKQQAFFRNNKDVFRKSIELTAGFCEPVWNNNLKQMVEVPISISFDSMDELEFRDLYDRVKDVLFETALKSISVEEFEKNLGSF